MEDLAVTTDEPCALRQDQRTREASCSRPTMRRVVAQSDVLYACSDEAAYRPLSGCLRQRTIVFFWLNCFYAFGRRVLSVVLD